MSKYDGCGLAYASGYDPKAFMDEDIDDEEVLDEDYVDWDDDDYEIVEDDE